MINNPINEGFIVITGNDDNICQVVASASLSHVMLIDQDIGSKYAELIQNGEKNNEFFRYTWQVEEADKAKEYSGTNDSEHYALFK